ncbi:MAG TPA: response regulator [Polyangiaceae bacterium]|jgi:DNA-binding NtrC family response regulator
MDGTEQVPPPQWTRPVDRALVIADDPWLRRALRRAVREVFPCTVELSSRLRRPARSNFDLVVLDVDLLSGQSFPLVESVIAWRPRPLTIVLSANAPASSAFELGRLGVESFLQKPFTLTELRSALTGAVGRRPSVESLGRSWVGRLELRAAQLDLRRGMLDQAMELSNGNLSRAARILSVSRQALQRTARATRAKPGKVEVDKLDQ